MSSDIVFYPWNATEAQERAVHRASSNGRRVGRSTHSAIFHGPNVPTTPYDDLQ